MSTPLIRLGDVAQLIRGVTFKPAQLLEADSPDAVVCLRTKNVQAELDLSDVLYVPASVVRNERQTLRAKDIVISSANSWNLVGKCVWVPAVDRPSTFGGFISVLRVVESPLVPIDARYLYYWFSSTRTQKLVRGFGQQTTNISNLNFDRTLALEIPLPSLPEQRRMAATLDEVYRLRQTQFRRISLLDELSQGLKDQIVRGDL